MIKRGLGGGKASRENWHVLTPPRSVSGGGDNKGVIATCREKNIYRNTPSVLFATSVDVKQPEGSTPCCRNLRGMCNAAGRSGMRTGETKCDHGLAPIVAQGASTSRRCWGSRRCQGHKARPAHGGDGPPVPKGSLLLFNAILRVCAVPSWHLCTAFV